MPIDTVVQKPRENFIIDLQLQVVIHLVGCPKIDDIWLGGIFCTNSSSEHFNEILGL